MRILVTGGTGLVGSKLVEFIIKQGHIVFAPTHAEMDITDIDNIENVIGNFKPEAVVHLAAHTNVKAAEEILLELKEKYKDNPKKLEEAKKKTQAWIVNVEGTINVAKAAKTAKAMLIFVSTGLAQPKIKRKSWYGETKYQAELALKAIEGLTFAIIKIDYPFGNLGFANDYVEKLIKFLEKGYQLVEDQYVAYTFLEDLCKAIEKVAVERKQGEFCVASGKTTPLEICTLVSDLLPELGKPKQISLVDFQKNWIVPLPKDAALDTKETEKVLGMKFTPWREAVTKFIKSRT